MGALLFRIVTDRHSESAGDLDPNVPPLLAKCIERLLTQAPERRFHSAEEVVAALAKARAAYAGPADAAAEVTESTRDGFEDRAREARALEVCVAEVKQG
jgi:hypothetical protein